MKLNFRWCGLALAFGLSSAGAATLNLKLDPDRPLILASKDQDVVVKIDLDTGRRPNRVPLNIAVVIDHSGSMAGAKIEKTKQAAMQLIDRLTPQDNLALIEFDDRVDVLFPSQHVVDREALKAQVQRIEPNDCCKAHTTGWCVPVRWRPRESQVSKPAGSSFWQSTREPKGSIG